MTRTLFALIFAAIVGAFAYAADHQPQARFVPNIIPGSRGKIDGFRVVDVERGNIYDKIGLKKNDIIKSVNGKKIDTPEKAMSLYESLKKDETTTITIERGGQQRDLTVHGASGAK